MDVSERTCAGNMLNTEGLPEEGLAFKGVGAKLVCMPQATTSAPKGPTGR